jgi:hypothetical protein
MSMSMTVIGFRPADDKWRKMKSVYEACEASGVETPDEVLEFFNYQPPQENGAVVQLTDFPENHECCAEWSADMEKGYEIDLSKLPKELTHIRFYCSW